MIRHIVIAAWRNMAANKLISAIAIGGLAIGITAALLMALVVRNQLTYDHFIPGHERTYLVVSRISSARWSVAYHDNSPLGVAALLKLNLPNVESTTRLMLPPWNLAGESAVTLKQGQIAADETIYWADPNVFDVLPLPVLRGDLASALRQPDGIVLPRATARKYFGHDDAVGQAILLNGHPMTVRAVIEDLPANGTSLQSGIFASGLASFSPLAGDLSRDASPVMTFVRLKPGVSSAAVQRRLPNLASKTRGTRYATAWLLTRLDRLPLLEGLHPGAKAKLAVTGIIGALILFIATINFVNLLTARAARRAKEVGMRKACGAGRRALVLQFLSESVLTVFLATCVAVALCEWLLPPVNTFLGTGARFDYAATTLGLLLAGILTLGLMAGAWPAFVLSSFRPSGVIKGVLQPSSGGYLIRKTLVMLQFAILIGLAVCATIVWQQNRYATREGLRANIDQMLVMRGGCKPAFRAEVRKLPGVVGASCTDISFIQGGNLGPIIYRGKRFLDMNYVSLDPGLFALYGIVPLAGTLPPASSMRADDHAVPARIILNAAAVKRLGLGSPQAAVGQLLGFVPHRGEQNAAPKVPILAVVPDFSFHALGGEPIAATIYTSGRTPFGDADNLVSIKLKGQQIPETLIAIDRAWAATNVGQPVNRFFLDAHMQELYLDMLRQAQLFAIFSGVAISLTCLGLLGLSIATAERRTKEIGIRKAMGAGNAQIVVLLLWQFAQPVLWANVIAWPVAWWLMRRWLSGFAYHVDLHWWVFAAASAGALAIALLTVAGQAFLTARQKPVLALRYE